MGGRKASPLLPISASLVLGLLAFGLLLTITEAQSAGWQTYVSADAAFSLTYPNSTNLTTSDDASLRYRMVYITLKGSSIASYQSITVIALENAANLSAQQWVAKQSPLSGASVHAASLSVAGRTALKLERDAIIGMGDKFTVLIPGKGVMYRISLYGGGEGGPIEPSAESTAIFDRIVQSFRVLPQTPTPRAAASTRASALDPAIATVFTYPLQNAAGVNFGVPAGLMTDNTHLEWLGYGERNLDLYGYRCYNVDWARLLHTAEDWYRLDGADTANSAVHAVADGIVERHDPSINYPGNVVLLRHRLPDGRDIYSMYGHVTNVSVVEGDLVQRGQQIGTVLTQAYWGRTPDQHPLWDSNLHFEMRWFADGSNIYITDTNAYGYYYPRCTWPGGYPGRGYTYLVHPDNYPYPDAGYVAPSPFIEAHLDTNPVLSYTMRILGISLSTETTLTCTDLVRNGSFEEPLPGGPWASIVNTVTAVYTDTLIDTARAHTGAQSGHVGSPALNSVWNEFIQTIQMPPGVVSATLTYWRYLTSTETAAYDQFSIGVETEQGVSITADKIDNSSAGRDTWVQGSVDVPTPATFSNRRLWLSIKGATDPNLPSTLYVDSISFVVCSMQKTALRPLWNELPTGDAKPSTGGANHEKR